MSRRTSRTTIALVVLAGLTLPTSAAHAGKPTKAEALKVAQAWVEALKAMSDADDAPLTAERIQGVAALTSQDFSALVITEGCTDGCRCEVSSTGKGGLRDALQCARQGFGLVSEYQEYNRKELKHLAGWSLSDHGKTFAKLARTERLVFVWGGCDYTHLVAVKKDADGVARVAAAFSGVSYSCEADQ